MKNQLLEETIIISEAITQTLNSINEKMINSEDVAELVVNLTNLTNRLNKKSERISKKHISNLDCEPTIEEFNTSKAVTETNSEMDIMNKIPQKYHEYISEVIFAHYYTIKLKEEYVAKNTRVTGEEFVNTLIDKNLRKIVDNLKTIKTV